MGGFGIDGRGYGSRFRVDTDDFFDTGSDQFFVFDFLPDALRARIALTRGEKVCGARGFLGEDSGKGVCEASVCGFPAFQVGVAGAVVGRVDAVDF